MLVDWIYVQRRRTPAAAFFQPPRSLGDRVVPSAIAAVAIGFVFGFWGDPPQTIRTAAPGTGIAPDSPTTQSAGR